MLNTKHIVRHYSNKLSSKYKKEYKLTPSSNSRSPNNFNYWGGMDFYRKLLAEVLSSKFGLTCTVRQHRPSQYRIYIIKSSVERLRTIVKPFIIPSMLYKIGL